MSVGKPRVLQKQRGVDQGSRDRAGKSDGGSRRKIQGWCKTEEMQVWKRAKSAEARGVKTEGSGTGGGEWISKAEAEKVRIYYKKDATVK